MDYYIRKFGKFFRKNVGGNILFEFVENKIISKSEITSKYQPVFIIGLPRSGTTLLYQLLIANFKFAYFTNFSSVFYKSPLLNAYLSYLFIVKYQSQNLRNNYGLVRGLWAPSEAKEVFNNWFKNEHLNTEQFKRIRNTCFNISELYQAPLLCKNLSNNYRLEVITKLFPDAKFIYIEREPIYNIQSIIIGRRKGYIASNTLGQTIKSENTIENVVNSFLLTKNNILNFLRNSKVDYFYVKYEELCNMYSDIIKRFYCFYEHETGQKIKMKDNKQFDIENSNKRIIDIDDWNKIKYLLKISAE